MEASKLKEILEQHKLWFEGKGGKFAKLEGADLRAASLTGADLRGADLEDADLTDANLTRASLEGAKLRDANLSYADLINANLSYANLINANLWGANLSGANLMGANLNYADLKDAILPDISWIIPGCLVQLNHIKYNFYLAKEVKWENFAQDSLGFIIQDNVEEKTFDVLVGDRIIRNIPHWVKYSGMKQVATV